MSNTLGILESIKTLSCLDDKQVRAIDVMQYGVIKTEKNAPVSEAVNLLVSTQVSGLPVTHEGRLVGMLSEKDVLLLLFKNDYLPGTVEEYMTKEVASFDIEESLCEISHFLVEKPFRRVPIMKDETIAGMITRSDLIKYYRQQSQTTQHTTGTLKSRDGLAEEIMQYGLLPVTSDTSITEAMDLIVKYNVPGLPVVGAQNALEGIITEKDLLTFICHPKAACENVGDLMTTNPLCFSPRDSIEKICVALISNSFYQVPVVEAGQLKGIISRADVLKYRTSFFKR